ncbi:MAG: YkgJ family cysteine cluster protein [Thermodesulfobacteriota bacterium]
MDKSKAEKVCYDCGGQCCRSVRIAINKKEPAGEIFLEKYYAGELPEGHELTDSVEREGNWIYDSNEEPCMFFDEETIMCTIQEKKPVICATFPVKWKHQHSLFVSLTCPLTHNVPLVDLVKSANKFKGIIAKIELYNFDQNNAEKYLSIRKLEHDYDLGVYK